jgi:transcriptional regulator with XRE-family HTH domain
VDVQQISNQDSSNYNVNDEQRRRELADFLRTRRERIKPIPGKFVQISRRRTPGLRREEVAELAGVGATWYTWLEQARDIQPSSEVLDRIARALELNPFEVKHLFTLAGKVVPAANTFIREEVPPAVKRMIDETINVPAIVLGERLDLLYWNSEYNYFFSAIPLLQSEAYNWMELIFCNEAARKSLVDWETHARRIIAEFRAAIGDQIGTPWAAELIDRLRTKSPEFADWWKSHDVRERVSLSFEILHPQLGKISFERSVYSPVDLPKIKLVMFTPLTPRVKTLIASPNFKAEVKAFVSEAALL